MAGLGSIRCFGLPGLLIIKAIDMKILNTLIFIFFFTICFMARG